MARSKFPERPSKTGTWWWRKGKGELWRQVLVTESVTSGRVCSELKMGGCNQVPWPDFSGEWSLEDPDKD